MEIWNKTVNSYINTNLHNKLNVIFRIHTENNYYEYNVSSRIVKIQLSMDDKKFIFYFFYAFAGYSEL